LVFAELDTADFETYIKNRYAPELSYYEYNAKKNKQRYQIAQIIVIISSVITPILIALNRPILQIIALFSSGIVTIVTSMLGVFKFHENWINYRTVAESLKKEKNFYDTKNCEYEAAIDPEKLFVLRTENLISREHSAWVSCQVPKEQSKSQS
jgi:hypothetical protein